MGSAPRRRMMFVPCLRGGGSSSLAASREDDDVGKSDMDDEVGGSPPVRVGPHMRVPGMENPVTENDPPKPICRRRRRGRRRRRRRRRSAHPRRRYCMPLAPEIWLNFARPSPSWALRVYRMQTPRATPPSTWPAQTVKPSAARPCLLREPIRDARTMLATHHCIGPPRMVGSLPPLPVHFCRARPVPCYVLPLDSQRIPIFPSTTTPSWQGSAETKNANGPSFGQLYLLLKPCTPFQIWKSVRRDKTLNQKFVLQHQVGRSASRCFSRHREATAPWTCCTGTHSERAPSQSVLRRGT
jgi:hypothetical protein